MASPQLQDGYTSIANEILDHLCSYRLTANQWQVILTIIRKTYGFHKKADYITNSQIVIFTGLDKFAVSKVMKALLQMKLIIKDGKNTGIQKDWELWESCQFKQQKLSETATKVVKIYNNNNIESCQNIQPELPVEQLELSETATKVVKNDQKKEGIHYRQKIKDTYTKDTYTKDIEKKPYGEFQNIFLSDNEYKKLVVRFGDNEAGDRVAAASESFQSHKDYSKKYSNHYATILSWARMDEKRNGGNGNERGNGKTNSGNESSGRNQANRYGPAGATGIRIIE
jgi:phage replication O-like protein O